MMIHPEMMPPSDFFARFPDFIDLLGNVPASDSRQQGLAAAFQQQRYAAPSHRRDMDYISLNTAGLGRHSPPGQWHVPVHGDAESRQPEILDELQSVLNELDRGQFSDSDDDAIDDELDGQRFGQQQGQEAQAPLASQVPVPLKLCKRRYSNSSQHSRRFHIDDQRSPGYLQRNTHSNHHRPVPAMAHNGVGQSRDRLLRSVNEQDAWIAGIRQLQQLLHIWDMASSIVHMEMHMPTSMAKDTQVPKRQAQVLPTAAMAA